MAPTPHSRRRQSTKSSRSGQLLRGEYRRVTPPGSPDINNLPSTKKQRLTSRDDVLRQLAQHAIDEMKLHGLVDRTQTKHRTNDDSTSRLQENCDPLVINSSQIEDDEDDPEKPQSPLSFLDRVGLRGTTKTQSNSNMKTIPPLIPSLVDNKALPHSHITSPSSCTSPESISFRRYSRESLGDITPATAHAAQCLLELRR